MISSRNFACMENATTQGRWPATKSFTNQWVKINSELAFLVFILHTVLSKDTFFKVHRVQKCQPYVGKINYHVANFRNIYVFKLIHLDNLNYLSEFDISEIIYQ